MSEYYATVLVMVAVLIPLSVVGLRRSDAALLAASAGWYFLALWSSIAAAVMLS